MIVYIVTHGEYSDYSIDGVYETEAQAIQIISSDNAPFHPSVEVWRNDEYIKRIKIDMEGKLEYINYEKNKTSIPVSEESKIYNQ